MPCEVMIPENERCGTCDGEGIIVTRRTWLAEEEETSLCPDCKGTGRTMEGRVRTLKRELLRLELSMAAQAQHEGSK